MTREQLEHVIRASAAITDCEEFVIVGSQSILGAHPDAPAALLLSNEVDLYPRLRPDLADLIDGSIGELSPFHQTFGYYGQGVSPETALLPDGWQGRLTAVRTPATRGATGWCLEPHDLVASKLAAGREKDLEFVRAAVAHGVVDLPLVEQRVCGLVADPEIVAAARERLSSCG